MKLAVKTILAIGGLASMLFLASNAGAAPLGTDAAEMQALMKSEPKALLIIDVRTPGEWSSGVIKGASLIQMKDVPANLGKIPREKKIVVVCASGARSGAVANFLSKEGYPWVKNYTGGMNDWQRRGLPVSKP